MVAPKLLLLLGFLAVSYGKRHCTGACKTKGSRGAMMMEIMRLKEARWSKLQRVTEETGYRPLGSGAAHCVDGMAADEYPCSGVDLLANTPRLTPVLGSLNYLSDIWGWTSAAGHEYALVGMYDGTSFVDITDPHNPRAVAFLPTAGIASEGTYLGSWWRDVKTYKNHAYIVADSIDEHGVQVVDLTTLPAGTEMTSDEIPVIEPTYHYTEFGQSHNIAINEDSGFAYAIGSDTCNGGPHIMDLSNPAEPEYVTCFPDHGWTHDSQCVIYDGPDAAFKGREICINFNVGNTYSTYGVGNVGVLDVTDKDNIVVLSQTEYSAVAYAHQGWLTDDHSYLLIGDEGDEELGSMYSFEYAQSRGLNGSWIEAQETQLKDGKTRTIIFDMRTLSAPVELADHFGTEVSIDHNMYIKDGYLYQANYCAGLRILSLANVASGMLEEVAHFDVSPMCKGLDFFGAWSLYPYFPSGNVVVSGIDRGLFVLHPAVILGGSYPHPPPAPSAPPPAACVPVVAKVYTAWDYFTESRTPDEFCSESDGELIQESLWWSIDTTTPAIPEGEGLPCTEYTADACLPPGTNYLRIADQDGSGQHGSLKVEVFLGDTLLASLAPPMASYCAAFGTWYPGPAATCAFAAAFTVPSWCSASDDGATCADGGVCTCGGSRRKLLFSSLPSGEDCYCI